MPRDSHFRPQALTILLLAVIAPLGPASTAKAFILAPNTRWTSTATNASTGDYGQPITLTWSLVPDGTSISNSYDHLTSTSSLISTFDTAFGAGPGGSDLTQRPWFHLFSDSFNRWNQLGGINFVYEPHDTSLTLGSSTAGTLGVRGDVRIGAANIDGASNTLAETLLPQVGDILIDTADMSFFKQNDATSPNNRGFRDTLMHETGHAFGLEHVISTTNEFLMAPVIDLNIDGPQIDEIRAIQYFYGDANEKSHNGQGNNTPALATPLGSLAVGGSFDVGSSAVGKTSGSNMIVSPNESDFVSVFGTTDADYYSFSVSTAVKLSAVVTPQGGTFDQGQQGGSAPTTFNAVNRNNLSLTLFGPDGTTQLAQVNGAAAGLAETLSDFSLSSAGRYYVRVTGSTADSVQLYDLKLSTVAAVLAGDFNHDGIVDAADYTVWRDELGDTGGGMAADANGDNIVNASDYAVWVSNFGHTAGGGGSGSLGTKSVPEPSTAALMLLPCVLFAMRCRRRGARPR
jgi:serralysin